MVTKQDVARAVATQPDGRINDVVMFEHGTVMTLTSPDETKGIAAAKLFYEEVGPYGGEGGPPGDFTPLKLKAFDGWLVEFCWGALIMTIVLPDDLSTPAQASPTEVFHGISDPIALAAGLRGRTLRNLDLRERKIVYRSWASE